VDSYIFADLIQRTAVFQKNVLAAQGMYPEECDLMKDVCRREKRESKDPQKGYTDYLWHRMRRMSLTTREMFFLVACWMLTVAKETPITPYTDDFQPLCDELIRSIEAGIGGDVLDISQRECEAEWERIRPMVAELHGIYLGLKAEKDCVSV